MSKNNPLKESDDTAKILERLTVLEGKLYRKCEKIKIKGTQGFWLIVLNIIIYSICIIFHSFNTCISYATWYYWGINIPYYIQCYIEYLF